MKLSIIVPIRNGERYLTECMDSILVQSFKDFELILVNNASTDKTQEIIQRYIEKDGRVIGLCADQVKVNEARKIGLDRATGEYVGFVDSDDWIDQDMYEQLISFCETDHLDMVSSGMIKEFVETGETQNCNDTVSEGVFDKAGLRNEIYPVMLSRHPFFTHGVQPNIWNKVYKRSLLLEVFRDLDTRIIYGEDATVVYAALLNAQRVGFTQRGFYHYRIHSASNTYTPQKEFLISIYYLNEQLKRTFEQDEQKDILLEQLKCFILSSDFFNLKRVFDIDVWNMMDWYMPFGALISGEKVAIWGAGRVGKRFYQTISSMKDTKILHWVDSVSGAYGGSVEPPDILEKERVDYVIIAIKDRNAMLDIRESLYRYGYSDEQILWQIYEMRLSL